MGQSDDIKIRTLPRTKEKQAKASEGKKPARLIIYIGTTSVLFLITILCAPKPTRSVKAPMRTTQSAPALRSSESVTRYLQEAQLKHDMMVHKSEIENLQFRTGSRDANEGDDLALPEQARNMGVQMDSENSAEHVYEDLNDTFARDNENLPADRINARLATRKWVNEVERRERLQFVSNFIRSAYDRGYEVEIDQNLVVVGVKRINEVRKVNINQVIDRLAKQGL